MATVGKLISRLEFLIDDTIDPQEAIDLFNEAQEELSPVSGYAKTSTFSFLVSQSSLSMPIDLVEFVEMKIHTASNDVQDPTQDGYYKRVYPAHLVTSEDIANSKWYMGDDIYGFEWFGDSVTLRPVPVANGTLLIDYYALLPTIPDYDNNPAPTPDQTNATLNFVPSLKQQFHKALPLYAAWKYAQNIKDELPMAKDFSTEYMEVRQLMERDFNWRKDRTRSKTVFQYRSWA